MLRIDIVGGGRAGGSLAIALGRLGWPPPRVFRRGDDLATAGTEADVVVIATPDAAIAEVAALIPAREGLAVAHLAGSLGIDVLGPVHEAAALHPLVALPDPQTGAQRLRGAWFAVAGAPIVGEIVDALGGRAFSVADHHRAAYHAAAVVASNHLVAVLGQAERIAIAAEVPFEALLDLVQGTVDNVVALGPAAALTGPAARGDEATIAAHLGALAAEELPTYRALVIEARRLAAQRQV